MKDTIVRKDYYSLKKNYILKSQTCNYFSINSGTRFLIMMVELFEYQRIRVFYF